MDAAISPRWLFEPSLQKVFSLLENEGELARVVGGAVRNTLFGEEVSDVDISTTALPETVMNLALKAGFGAIPTGVDHGTVTVVSDGVPYEITTLREDIETHGRRASVRFGTDWQRDAARRDFTMNAIYADRHGKLFDPMNGLPDLAARQVRYIGEAEERIREDYLRILRFFRFHAHYCGGAPDPEGLRASTALRDGIAMLSAERVGMELRKLLGAKHAVSTLAIMVDAGIAQVAFGERLDVERLRRLRSLSGECGDARDPLLGLAALCAGEDKTAAVDVAGRYRERLRLTNVERKRVLGALEATYFLETRVSAERVKELAFRRGRRAAIDAVLLSCARAGDRLKGPLWGEALTQAREFRAPEFPVSGADLIKSGVKPGPALGEMLEHGRKLWIASDFKAEKSALLAELKKVYL